MSNPNSDNDEETLVPPGWQTPAEAHPFSRPLLSAARTIAGRRAASCQHYQQRTEKRTAHVLYFHGHRVSPVQPGLVDGAPLQVDHADIMTLFSAAQPMGVPRSLARTSAHWMCLNVHPGRPALPRVGAHRPRSGVIRLGRMVRRATISQNALANPARCANSTVDACVRLRDRFLSAPTRDDQRGGVRQGTHH